MLQEKVSQCHDVGAKGQSSREERSLNWGQVGDDLFGKVSFGRGLEAQIHSVVMEDGTGGLQVMYDAGKERSRARRTHVKTMTQLGWSLEA